MARQIGNPAIKQGFRAVFDGARNQAERDAVAAAQKDVIAYYYDMVRVMVLRKKRPDKSYPFPDAASMRRAVTEINRACANQKKKYLFDGEIMNPADLFAFASGLVMPAAA